MAIRIRPLKESDLNEADQVIQIAFGRQVSVIEALRMHCQAEPGGFWVAEAEGTIVGTVGGTNYGSFAYISLMSVHPRWQRQGIGRRMMNHVLDWLSAGGCSVVLLDATEQGASLYRHMAFVDDSTAAEFESVSIAAQAQGASNNVALAAETDLDAIAAFDAPLFGANRLKILQVLWATQRQRCLVARDASGNIRGYLFARDPVLGPWAAMDAAVARNLLTLALALEFRHTPRVLVPRSNSLACELLTGHGFVERRRLRHMRRGGSGPPGQPNRLYGQTTFGHG